MRIGIVDLGINNTSSVVNAFSQSMNSRDSLELISSTAPVMSLDLLVLPGLGTFKSGMSSLEKSGLGDEIKKYSEQGIKLIGICLGMQLLGSESDESPGIRGLGLVNSKIRKLPYLAGERIPHSGWAEVNSRISCLPSLSSYGDFYFVHSYHMVLENNHQILATSPFGKSKFVSAIKSENILGFQFHPEKSGPKGKQLINDLLNWARNES